MAGTRSMTRNASFESWTHALRSPPLHMKRLGLKQFHWNAAALCASLLYRSATPSTAQRRKPPRLLLRPLTTGSDEPRPITMARESTELPRPVRCICVFGNGPGQLRMTPGGPPTRWSVAEDMEAGLWRK